MKLTALKVQNFQMLVDVRIDFASAPIVVVCGNNAIGKSSIAEAIRFALTDQPTRVELKRDWDQLIREGSKGGTNIEVHWVDSIGQPGWSKVNLPGGAVVMHSHAPTPLRNVLALLLDPPRIAAMPANDLRSVLFGLAGLGSAGAKERLLELGRNPEFVEVVAPLLLAGFAAACEEAKDRTSTARGVWKGITGEVYGKIKADAWKAPRPPEWEHATWDIEAMVAEINGIETKLHQAHAEAEGLRTRLEAKSMRERRLGELRPKADQIEALTGQLKTDERAVADQTAKVQAMRLRAAGADPVEPFPCPHCGGMLVLDGTVKPYQKVKEKDKEAVAMLAGYEKALATANRVLAATKRDYEISQAALLEIKNITTAPDDGITDEQLLTARQEITAIQDRLRERRKEYDLARRATQEVNAAADKTARAAQAHADVVAWDLIAKDLAPDGIPSEMMTSAIKPVNERLRETANATGWAQVTIDEQMQIRADGRLYKLRSDSERWRIDAALAEALSYISGLRIICLDRMDELDIPGRGQCIGWLEDLAGTGDLQTALVCATLKNVPNLPVETFTVLRLDSGMIEQQDNAQAEPA